MQPGDVMQVRALKGDGSPYRWWDGIVEMTTPDYVAILNRVGDPVEGVPRGWTFKQNHRLFYWFGRPYNLAEVYEPNGRLKQLYVHIASLPRIEGTRLVYKDLELDVIKRPGQPVRVADEDEFAAAAIAFGYPPELQEACWRAVEEAKQLVRYWRPSGFPRARLHDTIAR